MLSGKVLFFLCFKLILLSIDLHSFHVQNEQAQEGYGFISVSSVAEAQHVSLRCRHLDVDGLTIICSLTHHVKRSFRREQQRNVATYIQAVNSSSGSTPTTPGVSPFPSSDDYQPVTTFTNYPPFSQFSPALTPTYPSSSDEQIDINTHTDTNTRQPIYSFLAPSASYDSFHR